MRRTPIKRSGFARKVPLRSPRLALDIDGKRAPLRPIRAVAPREPVFCPQPKHEYVRSEALRVAFRLIPCQWEGCGVEDGTVCCAHSNWGEHGKGSALKADDSRAAALCWRHHAALDQGGRLSDVERKTGWGRAHVRSVAQLVDRGLWPAGVPVPDTSSVLEGLAP